MLSTKLNKVPLKALRSGRNRPYPSLKKEKNIWKAKPDADDYLAAERYLRLLFTDTKVKLIVTRLRGSPITQHQAKDLLRASQVHLIDNDNPQVAAQLKKINKGKKISPVLLVRGDALNGITLTIADGHHRICASWHWNEDLPVACCLVSPD